MKEEKKKERQKKRDTREVGKEEGEKDDLRHGKSFCLLLRDTLRGIFWEALLGGLYLAPPEGGRSWSGPVETPSFVNYHSNVISPTKRFRPTDYAY